jgi:hypothetical protein
MYLCLEGFWGHLVPRFLPVPVKVAVFDTRSHGPAALTGRASTAGRVHRAHGPEVIVKPESFLVTKQIGSARGRPPGRVGAKLAASAAQARVRRSPGLQREAPARSEVR